MIVICEKQSNQRNMKTQIIGPISPLGITIPEGQKDTTAGMQELERRRKPKPRMRGI
jgi:hypothetical protein